MENIHRVQQRKTSVCEISVACFKGNGVWRLSWVTGVCHRSQWSECIYRATGALSGFQWCSVQIFCISLAIWSSCSLADQNWITLAVVTLCIILLFHPSPSSSCFFLWLALGPGPFLWYNMSLLAPSSA